MATEDDKPAADSPQDGEGAAELFAPPTRRSRLRANWMMLGALLVVSLAVVVFIVALATA